MNKRLVGGMILLNLCAISLSINGDEVDITDEDVKSQLVELRNFIDEKRDFTKGAKDLKPVLVQYRSSVSKIDGIVQCNMGFNTDALHLSIGGTAVLSTGDKLTININVVYQYTNYVGYTIKTAKLNVTTFEKTNVDIDDAIATIDLDELKISSLLQNGRKVNIILERNSDIYMFATGVYNEFSSSYDEILCTPLSVEVGETNKFITRIVINKTTKVCTFFDETESEISSPLFQSIRIF